MKQSQTQSHDSSTHLLRTQARHSASVSSRSPPEAAREAWTCQNRVQKCRITVIRVAKSMRNHILPAQLPGNFRQLLGVQVLSINICWEDLSGANLNTRDGPEDVQARKWSQLVDNDTLTSRKFRGNFWEISGVVLGVRAQEANKYPSDANLTWHLFQAPETSSSTFQDTSTSPNINIHMLLHTSMSQHIHIYILLCTSTSPTIHICMLLCTSISPNINIYMLLYTSISPNLNIYMPSCTSILPTTNLYIFLYIHLLLFMIHPTAILTKSAFSRWPTAMPRDMHICMLTPRCQKTCIFTCFYASQHHQPYTFTRFYAHRYHQT